MSQVFYLACGAEFADVFLGGFGCDVKSFSDGEIGATVEFTGEAIEEGLTENGDGATSGVGVGGWECRRAEPTGAALLARQIHGLCAWCKISFHDGRLCGSHQKSCHNKRILKSTQRYEKFLKLPRKTSTFFKKNWRFYSCFWRDSIGFWRANCKN